MAYITIQQASERSGLSERRIRQMCETLAQRGQARQMIAGGKLIWHIAEMADPRFLRVPLPEHLPTDLRDAKEADRTEALRRRAIVQQWSDFVKHKLTRGMTRTKATDCFLAAFPELNVSRASLYRWESAWRSEGLRGLLPKYAGTDQRISDEAVAEFRRLYLTQNKLSVSLCWKMVRTVAAQQSWDWFGSERACQRWVGATFTKPELILNRDGEDAYTAICAPYIERDPDEWMANECWVGDHHQFDFWVTHRGKLLRPWLTAWQDMRSRMIVGWVISPSPNQTTILGAFRQGCKSEFGPPSHCYIDNGKDYDSFTFHGQTKRQRKGSRKKVLEKGYLEETRVKGLFGQLGITVTFAIPYNARAKIIERFFGTCESQYGKTFSTYCGNSPTNRPDDLQKRLDRGEGIPTMEDVIASFARYLEEVYHASPHSGAGMDGISPLAFMRSNQVARRVADETVLDLLLQVWGRPVKVTKSGITHKGIHYGIGNIELMNYQGRFVRFALDPNDISELRVMDMDGRFICTAKAGGLVNGVRDEDVREGIKLQRHIKKSLKAADDVRHLAHRDVTDLALTAAAQRAKEELGDTPERGDVPFLRPIKTDLEAAIMHLTKPLKKVSGDEVNPIRLPDSDIFADRAETCEDATNLIEERLLKLSKPK